MHRVLCLTLGLLALSGCSSVEESDPPLAPTEAGDTAGTAGPGDFKVRFETTKGEFVIQVHRDWAPIGAEQFHTLVANNFYDDCAFFRAIPGFMAQFGIAGDPEMNTKWKKEIRDDPVIESNRAGYVTFAKTGAPNSRSTQVFINFEDNTGLDAQGFAPFAQVIEGMEVVHSLNTEYGDPPGDTQMRLTYEGNAYLRDVMPNLDYIITAKIVEE